MASLSKEVDAARVAHGKIDAPLFDTTGNYRFSMTFVQ